MSQKIRFYLVSKNVLMRERKKVKKAKNTARTLYTQLSTPPIVDAVKGSLIY